MTIQTITAPGGQTFPVDQIAGVAYPLTKIVFGTVDALRLVDESDPLPVEDAATKAAVDGLSTKLPTGQAAKAASRPVVLASDHDPVLIEAAVAILRAVELMTEGPHIDPLSGRMRVMLDPLGGAQTLGTVTTVSTVTTVATLTSMAQIAGIPANSVVYDLMDTAWANCIRARIA